MKKLIIAAVVVLMSAQAFAITITISCTTKSKWDGSICAPVDKGLCIRGSVGAISSNEFNGNISYDKSQGIIMTFSKSKDMSQTIYSSYFSGGIFNVDGDSQISADILKRIAYPYSSNGLTIKQGKYKYSIIDDIITVIIPVDNFAIVK